LKKFSFIFFVFILPFSVGACSLKQYKYCETAVGKKCTVLQQDNFGQDSRDELPLYRKKSKSRGIQEFVPLVQKAICDCLPFASYVIFANSDNPIIQKIQFTQFLRGPPCV